MRTAGRNPAFDVTPAKYIAAIITKRACCVRRLESRSRRWRWLNNTPAWKRRLS